LGGGDQHVRASSASSPGTEGLAAVLGREREVDQHLMRLHGDDPDALERHLTRAFWLWRRRSVLRWESDLGPWAPGGDITGPLDPGALLGVIFEA